MSYSCLEALQLPQDLVLVRFARESIIHPFSPVHRLSQVLLTGPSGSEAPLRRASRGTH